MQRLLPRMVPSASVGGKGARIAWILIAILAVACFAVSVPTYHQQVRNLSGPSLTDGFQESMDPEGTRAALRELGWTPEGFAFGLTLLFALFGLTYIAAGTFIFLRRPGGAAPWLVSLWLVAFGATFSPLAAALEHQGSPLGRLVGLLGTVALACFFVLLAVFPDGRFVPRWTRHTTALFLAVVTMGVVLPGTALDPAEWGAAGTVLQLVLAASMLYAQVWRYRRAATEMQRRRTRWVAASLVLALITIFASSLSGVVGTAGPGTAAALLFGIAQQAGIAAVFLLIPLATVAAVVQYRLWDIEVILNRSLVFAALTGCSVAIYAGIVAGLGALLRSEHHPLVSLLAAGTIAVLFAPLRERLQRSVNRLMYGERDDPYSLVARLGRQLGLAMEPDSVLPTIVETLRGALKLPHAAITLAQDGTRLSAAVGEDTGRGLVLPLVHGGSTLGTLRLGQREGQDAFPPREIRLLDDLARQVSVAARAVLLHEKALRLARDLQVSRERIVTAREEERRRLRRDLHDGLGPTLASQGLLLDAARNLLPRDPKVAGELLDELSRHLRSTVDDLRRVVHGLRPPTLDELGLVGALEEKALQLGRDRIDIRVDAPEGLPMLPAATEVAIYYIAVEALTNVVRHARAGTCRVRLTLEPDRRAVVLEIADDGCGVPENGGTGVGLHAMLERAEEVGGGLSVTRRPEGGTRVRAVLPLPPEGP